MKFQTIKPILGSLAIAVLLSATGCTAMTGETAGQNIDDSTITASVKTKLAADKIGSLTRIDVDTTRQVVSLNGVVESPEQKARAEQLVAMIGSGKDIAAPAGGWNCEAMLQLAGTLLFAAMSQGRPAMDSEPFAELAHARLGDVEALYLEKLMKTRDANEGLRAFIHKRQPKWEHR